MGIYIQENFENATEGYAFGISEVYETRFETASEVYKFCLKEYGRCIGKVHVDQKSKVLEIGWIFQKRMQYEDCNETYWREVWVTMHSAPETKTTEYHYLKI